MTPPFRIRDAGAEDFAAFGALLVAVYAQLDGFPSPRDQPDYYRLLAEAGRLTDRPGVGIRIATSQAGVLLGGVVHFDDMAHYGSGGSATRERNAAGIRLLGVRPDARGLGIGKALTQACIEHARALGREQMILHTTEAMQVAWGLYVRLGFRRSEDLDFVQNGLPVFGFRLRLTPE